MPSSSKAGRVRRVICLVTDRLSAGALGAYGNTWIATPHFSRLAAESFLFDQAIVDGPTLDQFYRSVWLGVDATRSANDTTDAMPLARALADRGLATTLLTDDDSVRDHPLAQGFGQCTTLPCVDDAPVATTEDETHLAGFFAMASELLEEHASQGLVWLHTQGMAAPWDAPLELRDAYAAEDDPPPPRSSEVPCRRLPPDVDPDERLGIAQAYAGQVTLWDTCLGALLDAMEARALLDESLVVVLSVRGFPLGEHHAVGAVGGDLYGELVHVPWALRFPGGASAAQRTSALVQPSDLYGLILDCLQPEGSTGSTAHGLLDLVAGRRKALRDHVLVTGAAGQRAIRTPEWYLRMAARIDEPTATESSQTELYVKPDDRWEINDVSDRCEDVVADLEKMLQEPDTRGTTGEIS